MNLQQCHLLTQAHDKQEFAIETAAKVVAKNITGFNNKQHHQFMEIYSLSQGLTQFGSKEYQARMAGIEQLHERRRD